MTPEHPILSGPTPDDVPAPIFRSNAPHPLVRFLLAAILVVLANLFIPIITFLTFAGHPLLADTAYRWLAAAVLAGGFLLYTRVLDQWDGDAWLYQGLPWRPLALTQAAAGFAISAVLITIAVASVALIGQLSLGFRFSGATIAHQLLAVVLLIGGAALEELAFRGYPFQRLVEAIRPLGAIIVLSVFFGAVHLQNPNSQGILSLAFFNTILVGVLFAYAYLRTRTLWLPIGMHFGWNFFLGVVYGLPVSGIRDFSIVVRSTAHGPRLLTGGPYGLEASLTGTLVLLLGFLLVAWAPRPELASISVPQRDPDPGI
jgi:membrane protease YdiL (CAAX protease family)